MSYFVTGLSGFIGNQFLEYLNKREGTIYALVRESSVKKLDDLRHKYGVPADKLVPVVGDLNEPLLGVAADKIGEIKDVDGFYHLGAIYDLSADQAQQQKSNVEGTKEAVKLAEKIGAKCFHHVSSIVAAGFYEGTFTEEMFYEAKDLDKNPYFLTKHLSEKVVREDCSIPWRVYRPGIVIGHSETGWINKIDGPYYFFNIINKMSELLPRWVPLPKYKGNPTNVVPVDFVAKAMDHIGHQPGLDGKCFHLTDPKAKTFGQVMNEFLKAAKGPTMQLDIPAERLKDFLPMGWRMFLNNKAIVSRVKMQAAENIGIPKEVLLTEDLNTTYDCANTLAALEGSGIAVPDLRTYARRLWNYWEQHLNPEHQAPFYLSDVVKGQTVIVTGGSEGIGKQVATNCVEAGAKVILVARTQEKLDAAQAELSANGGDVHTYSCDLTDMEACDAVIDKILDDHGHVDVLVNNAGRSIRRSLKLTYDRFHDFERVMQVNYFSAVRLAMRLMPSMTERKSGHIVNISSIVALGFGSPRFSSYVASKTALDAWSNTAAIEYAKDKISFTNIHMPLVRTKMIEATTQYQNVNVLNVNQAGRLVDQAIINKPREINTFTGTFMRHLGVYAPDLNKLILSTLYQMTDDSEAAKAAASKAAVEAAAKQPLTVAEKAMDALQKLQLDKETLESINQVLQGYHT